MTICPKFEMVTLWDLRLNCEFELLGRIPEKDKQVLKTMLLSDNQLIEKDNIFRNSEEMDQDKGPMEKKELNIKESKRDEMIFERHHSKSEIPGINIEENFDEQDIIDNQKIDLMQRDKRNKPRLTKNTKSNNTGYDFLERKKKDENQRLQESKGGYQIAVHDFYFKGQKGRLLKETS
jgi:hypothetical protein